MDKNEQTPGAMNKPFTRNTKKIKFGDEQGKSLAERFEFDGGRATRAISEPDYKGDGEEHFGSDTEDEFDSKNYSEVKELPTGLAAFGSDADDESEDKEPPRKQKRTPKKPTGTLGANLNSIIMKFVIGDLNEYINDLNNLISNYSEQTSSTSEPNLLALAQNIIKFYSHTVNIDITEGYNINNDSEDNSLTPHRENPSHFQVLPHPAMWRHLKYCAQSWVEFYHYKSESDKSKLLAEAQNNSSTDALMQEALDKLAKKDTELSQPNESCDYDPNYKAAEYLKDINDILQALDDSPSIMSDFIKNKKNELHAKIIFHTLERLPVCSSPTVSGLKGGWISEVLTLLTKNRYDRGGNKESQELLRDFALLAKHSPCVSIGVLLPFLYVFHDSYIGYYNQSYRDTYKRSPSAEGENSIERQQAIHAHLHQSLDLEKLFNLIDQLDKSISRLKGSNDVLAEASQRALDLLNQMKEQAKPLSTEDQVTQQAQISTQIDCPDAMPLHASTMTIV